MAGCGTVFIQRNNRQNAELDALYVHVIAVRSLLQQSGSIDADLLDKVLEAAAKKRDVEGSAGSARRIRKLKSTSEFIAEI